MLFSRGAELERIDRLLAGFGNGQGFALVLRADIGIGKSALLDAVAERPGAGHVLRVCGTPSESEVAFSGLSELAQPLLANLADLPAHQADALRAVLTLSDGTVSGALAVFVAVTSFLASGAESLPRLCLVDDAQWLDAASADALLFAARRLTERPVGFVFAVREGAASAFDANWLPTMVISPLSEAVARDLAAAVAPRLASSVLDSVVAAAEGNPLALVEFARMADTQAGREGMRSRGPRSRGPRSHGLQPHGFQPHGLQPHGPLRVSERLERAFGARAADLPAAARLALVVLATAETSRLEIIASAVAAATGTSAALDPAVDAGLVIMRDDRVAFRHPLVRSAVYQAAALASLRAAHVALAAALAGTEPERAAWHRALAAPALDEQVAADLERTAALAHRRGGHVAEARALERAARLSPDAGLGTARLLAAGTAALLAGEHAWARSLLEEVTGRTDDPLVLADAEHELAQLAFWREGRRSGSLQAAVRRVEPLDPARAARLYSFELAALITDYRVSAALPIAERAWALIGHGVEPFEVSFRVAHVLVMAGRTAAAAALADRAAHAVEAAGNTTAMIMLSQPLWWLERYDTARDLLDAATAELRASGGLWMLCHALVATAELERRVGRLGVAYSSAAEALALAEQLDEPMQQTEALYELAAAEAALGQEVQARAHAEQALRIIAGRSFGVAEIRVATAAALGGAALAADRPQEAAQRLAPAVELVLSGGVADPALVPCIADLIEAYVACGRSDAASPLCDWLAEQAERCDRKWARLAAVRCRTLLGAADSGDLRQALADDDGATRLETARSWLALGARLRREGHRRDAGLALRRANEIFETAGASRWAVRAAGELRACGEKAPDSPGAPVALLTPRETRVAMLVAQGARSREVASALFLSERTVESHLAAVYRKLGVRSRTELAVHLAAPASIREEVQ
jgi:DNA-binding CsgD family transcriptional regulator